MPEPKTHWTEEDIIRLASLRAEGVTIRGAAESLGRSEQAIRTAYWRFRDRLPPVKANIRAMVAAALAQPHTLADVARDYSLSLATVKRWKQRLAREGKPVYRWKMVLA